MGERRRQDCSKESRPVSFLTGSEISSYSERLKPKAGKLQDITQEQERWECTGLFPFKAIDVFLLLFHLLRCQMFLIFHS